MSELRWVRELSPGESVRSESVSTGERLSDGSVLLWLEDIHHMGLEGLRRWLTEKVVEEHSPVVLAARRQRNSTRLPERATTAAGLTL